jgi:hypothetical protein
MHIELTQERVVSFQLSPKNQFTFYFRRLTPEDWKKFFVAIAIESETEKDGRTDRIDFRTASLLLFEDTIQRVEGYKTSSGDFMALPNWRDRIPFGHKIKAAEFLQEVKVSEEDREYIIDASVDEVYLDVTWGSSRPGTMSRYTGIIHRFNPPTVKQRQKFTRALSESRVIGGSRTNKTIYPGRQGLLAELYDELVVSVEGYMLNGAPLTNVEVIRKEMDTFHKVAAVQQLFTVPDVE